MAGVSQAQLVQSAPQSDVGGKFLRVGQFLLDWDKFDEQKRQFNAQRASQDLDSYVKANAGGDYKYAAQRNPDVFREYAKIAYPNQDPDKFVRDITEGPQTYAQQLAATAAEIAAGRIAPDTNYDFSQFLDKGKPENSAPAGGGSGNKGGAAPGGDKGNTPGGDKGSAPGGGTILTTQPVPKKTVDWAQIGDLATWDNLPTDSLTPLPGYTPNGTTFTRPDLASIGLTDDSAKSIRSTPEYKAFLDVMKKPGMTRRGAIAILSTPSVEEPNTNAKPATYSPQSGATTGTTEKGTSQKLSTGVEQAAEGILNGSTDPNTVARAVDQKLQELTGFDPRGVITKSEMVSGVGEGKKALADKWAKAQGLSGWEEYANMRQAMIQNIVDRNSGKSVDYGTTRNFTFGTDPVESTSNLDASYGSKITEITKSKEYGKLTDREKIELGREVDKAFRGAIKEFRFQSRSNESLEKNRAALEYTYIANNLRAMGLDTPESHPVMRLISNYSQMTDDRYKQALTEQALSSIMSKEDAKKTLEIAEIKAKNETAKLMLEANKNLQDLYKTNGDLLDKALKDYMANAKITNIKTTNVFAEAYKYDPNVKRYFDNIQDLNKKLDLPTQTPNDINYQVGTTGGVAGVINSIPILELLVKDYQNATLSFGGGGMSSPEMTAKQQAIREETNKLRGALR